MQLSNSRPSRIIYDLGAGTRLVSGVIFASIGIVALIYLARNMEEFREFPRYLRSPVAALVLLAGGILVAWCIGLTLWIPLRTLIFPHTIEGAFSGFRVLEESRGGRYFQISLTEREIRSRYNPPLAKALESLSEGTQVRFLVGAGGQIIRVETF